MVEAGSNVEGEDRVDRDGGPLRGRRRSGRRLMLTCVGSGLRAISGHESACHGLRSHVSLDLDSCAGRDMSTGTGLRTRQRSAHGIACGKVCLVLPDPDG